MAGGRKDADSVSEQAVSPCLRVAAAVVVFVFCFVLSVCQTVLTPTLFVFPGPSHYYY